MLPRLVRFLLLSLLPLRGLTDTTGMNTNVFNDTQFSCAVSLSFLWLMSLYNSLRLAITANAGDFIVQCYL
jgi:hypothetical protein